MLLAHVLAWKPAGKIVGTLLLRFAQEAYEFYVITILHNMTRLYVPVDKSIMVQSLDGFEKVETDHKDLLLLDTIAALVYQLH